MKLFLVSLFFEVTTEHHVGQAQFDEQWRLIKAETESEAWQIAENIGRQQETSFFNIDNRLVTWKFLAVSDLYSLQNKMPGEQIFGITHETTDLKEFREKIELKSQASAAFISLEANG